VYCVTELYLFYASFVIGHSALKLTHYHHGSDNMSSDPAGGLVAHLVLLACSHAAQRHGL
jgi:hypothetical protein